jgi:type IV pilus assembly protein PilY1
VDVAGFFVVDLATGSILWSFNRNSTGGGAMNHALPAMAAVIDSDMDGFADRAYVGDLGGNIWRFSFCKASDGDGCTTAHWKGTLFYQRDGNTGPVYYAPAVARDVVGDIWVYWGTGDRLEPLARKEYKDGFFGVRDQGKSAPLTRGNLQNISGATQQFTELDTKDGWYILLGGQGEKVLANPTVFGGVAYFTTYTPESAGGDPCEQAGNARLYGISYIDGTGTFTGGERSAYLGKGISSAPLVSSDIKAGKGGMFGWVSGGSNTGGTPWKGPATLMWPANMTHLLHWRDARFR